MQELNGEIRLTINTQPLSQLIFKPKLNTGRSKSKKNLKKRKKDFKDSRSKIILRIRDCKY